MTQTEGEINTQSRSITQESTCHCNENFQHFLRQVFGDARRASAWRIACDVEHSRHACVKCECKTKECDVAFIQTESQFFEPMRSSSESVCASLALPTNNCKKSTVNQLVAKHFSIIEPNRESSTRRAERAATRTATTTTMMTMKCRL
jgi:hypothetical protein